MQPEVRPGEEFAGHRVERVIGRGGVSVVYLAEHLRLGRNVALKVLFPHLADDPGFRDRFIRESRTAARVDHPNIVDVYDAGEVDGLLYLSMRFVDGRDLRRVLEDIGALDPWRAMAIAAQIASALDAAHEDGLVHRDVKPGNILLSGEGTPIERAYLSDFGITKRMDTREALTRTGQFVGTVDYVAPEQILGGEIDGRTDVYSLGCVLFECFTGTAPFPRPTDVATIYAHLHDPPPSMPPDAPPGMEPVIARALAKERGDRYDSCHALVEAARSRLDGVQPTVAFERPPSGGGGRRRRPGKAIPAVVAVALAVILIAVALSLRDDPGGTTAAPSGSGTPSDVPNVGQSEDIFWNENYWTRIQQGSPSGQAAASAATYTASGVVVAGGHVDDPDEDAAVWTRVSDDDWISRQLPEGDGTGDERIWDLASVGDRVVAVGYASGSPAAWVSTDAGETWAAAEVPDPDATSMTGTVAAADGTFIAFGRASGAPADRSAMWTSADGAAWRRIHPSTFEEGGERWVSSAVPVGDTTIAVGRAKTLDGLADAAVWEHRDGEWGQVSPARFAAEGEQMLLDVAVDGDIVVAVGGSSDGDQSTPDSESLVWTRDATGRWRKAHFPNEPGTALVSAVAVVDEGFLAAGWAASPGADADAAVWVSADGVSWSRQPPDTEEAQDLGGFRPQGIRALLPLNDRGLVYAFGEEVIDASTETSRAQLWVGHV